MTGGVHLRPTTPSQPYIIRDQEVHILHLDLLPPHTQKEKWHFHSVSELSKVILSPLKSHMSNIS